MTNEPMMTTEMLSELVYSMDIRGPLALYIYRSDGYHTGKVWFQKKPRYPDEEITVERARELVDAAIIRGVEVRICNSGDFLVFHAKGGSVLFPFEGDFWKDLMA